MIETQLKTLTSAFSELSKIKDKKTLSIDSIINTKKLRPLEESSHKQ